MEAALPTVREKVKECGKEIYAMKFDEKEPAINLESVLKVPTRRPSSYLSQ
jgi:hypothetical protein